ncbi:alpha/beta hydrolase [Streptomyces sp. NPDC050504]|uniref:alpha/beta hydrolase n=1 Tax=Streptomyces sp. NPDC050504 TaxID=3365618 RepID=UPI0037B62CC5
MKRTPVVFIHGAWLHALSWEPWVERFASRGFLACAPGWPGAPETAGELRGSPGVLRGIGLDVLTDHYAGIVRSFDIAPVIIGHSVGGLIAQHLIAADIGRAAVAIAPSPVNDVPQLELPFHVGQLTEDAEQVVSLSPERFHQVVANTVAVEEARLLHERYAVPAPLCLLSDLGYGGGHRSPRAAADVVNARRGPLLLVSGQEDRLVPDAATRAVYKQYGDTTAVTDLKQFADRAHSLVIDGGWRLVADHVLRWLSERGVRARPPES